METDFSTCLESADLTSTISNFSVKLGDTLVVNSPRPLSISDSQRLAEHIRVYFPMCAVMVLDPGVHISAVISSKM